VQVESSNPFRPSRATGERVRELQRRLAFGPAEGLRAVIVGAGKSGTSAAALLRSRGAPPEAVLVDDPALIKPDPRLAGIPVAPIAARAMADADLVILSPGVPRSRPELAGAIERGAVVGEIELASWFVRAPLVGITGTNGKSTTTALVGHLFEAAGLRTFTGGNLGQPLAELAASGREVDVAVVELSSFQLESIVEARFEVACWLNLTPDHVDRYPDHASYAAAKERLIESRTTGGVAVLNEDDRALADVANRAGPNVRWFSTDLDRRAPLPGTALSSRDRAIRVIGALREEYDLENPALPGLHNRSNMCAAIECARHLGAAPDKVRDGLRTFRGLPHRIELVGRVGGARWYNDSKATNVDSTLTALRALDGPKILIAGGRDKGAPWEPLLERASELKAVLAIGEAAPIVLRTFRGKVGCVEETKTLDAAVQRARSLAAPGDAVLLAPACASYDQFDNYEHRGDTFRRLVAALEPQRSGS
jgi:UDP-N-acetylmuramoylalanine--D-glutamate ligase